MRAVRHLVRAALGGALMLAACGGGSGDLLALEVSGGPQERELRIVVTGDGRARCGDGPVEEIPSQLLLDAREVERETGELADRGARFERRAEGRVFVLRSTAGTVRWNEGARGLPGILPRAQVLALALDRELCR